MVKDLEWKMKEEWMKCLGLFILEKRKLWRELTAVYGFLMRESRRGWTLISNFW